MKKSAAVANTSFDYASLSAEKAASARVAAERIRGRMQLAAESIIEVGRELIEQKKALGHGNYLAWIEAEFSMSADTASRFINVANNIGEKFRSVRNLPPTALYALAAPSTSTEVREQVEERASKGEKVTAAEIGNTAPWQIASRRSFQIDRRLNFIGKPYPTQKPKRPWRGFQQR